MPSPLFDLLKSRGVPPSPEEQEAYEAKAEAEQAQWPRWKRMVGSAVGAIPDVVKGATIGDPTDPSSSRAERFGQLLAAGAPLGALRGAKNAVGGASGGVRAYKGGYPYDDAGKVIDQFKSVGVRTPGAFDNYVGKKGGFAGFFSGDPKVASRFAEGPGSAVFQVDIDDFSRPLVIDAQGSSSANLQFADMAKKPHEKAALMEMWDTLRGKNSGGYDGIIIKNTLGEGTVYVPLRSDQVENSVGREALIQRMKGDQ